MLLRNKVAYKCNTKEISDKFLSFLFDNGYKCKYYDEEYLRNFAENENLKSGVVYFVNTFSKIIIPAWDDDFKSEYEVCNLTEDIIDKLLFDSDVSLIDDIVDHMYNLNSVIKKSKDEHITIHLLAAKNELIAYLRKIFK